MIMNNLTRTGQVADLFPVCWHQQISNGTWSGTNSAPMHPTSDKASIIQILHRPTLWERISRLDMREKSDVWQIKHVYDCLEQSRYEIICVLDNKRHWIGVGSQARVSSLTNVWGYLLSGALILVSLEECGQASCGGMPLPSHYGEGKGRWVVAISGWGGVIRVWDYCGDEGGMIYRANYRSRGGGGKHTQLSGIKADRFMAYGVSSNHLPLQPPQHSPYSLTGRALRVNRIMEWSSRVSKRRLLQDRPFPVRRWKKETVGGGGGGVPKGP